MTKTASTESPVKSSWFPRPETPAIGKEPSSDPLLISCGFPLTIQRSMPVRSRRAEAHRMLGPATPPSRNRGSCPNRTPLTDFCFQTPSTGTPANNRSPHGTALSRIPLPNMTEATRAVGGTAPELPPAGPRRAGRTGRRKPSQLAYSDAEADFVPSPSTSLSPQFCCSEPED